MEPINDLQQARRRVATLKGFYIHLLVYCCVNTLLFISNWLTPGPWWFYFPLLGWGIGLAVQALVVFGAGGFLGPQWERNKTDELMHRR
jgi:2TM domain